MNGGAAICRLHIFGRQHVPEAHRAILGATYHPLVVEVKAASIDDVRVAVVLDETLLRL